MGVLRRLFCYGTTTSTRLIVVPPRRLRKIFERAVGVYIRDGLAVNDQRRAWLGASADLHYVTMQFGGANFQQHFLALPLRPRRNLKGVACRADVLLPIRSHTSQK